jgi:hypothetical protein
MYCDTITERNFSLPVPAKIGLPPSSNITFAQLSFTCGMVRNQYSLHWSELSLDPRLLGSWNSSIVRCSKAVVNNRFLFATPPPSQRCNFSSTLYPQSCWLYKIYNLHQYHIKINEGTKVFSQSKIIQLIFYQLLMWVLPVNEMIELVSVMPAPRFGDESSWVQESELDQSLRWFLKMSSHTAGGTFTQMF